MKICINPGHTLKGIGSGAVGIKNESEENRKVAGEVMRLLKELGHQVIEARVDSASTNEEYLRKCVKIANNAKVELFTSIHFNSFNKSASGVEALVYRESNDASKFGSRICEKISGLGFKNRGVKGRTDLYVLKNTTMSAVLVECCFIDNEGDMAKYDYKTIGKAIAEGITGENLWASGGSDGSNNGINGKLYRVCVGSYRDKNNAHMKLKELEEDGYKDVFIYTK